MKVQLRSPKEIMKLSRLGCFHQSKLSFLRSFLEEFKDWNYSRDLFELDKDGYGKAVYSFSKNKKVYSLICFANELHEKERSDRVIATKWDAAFVLYDGVPSKKDIDRLYENVPKQEVGRLSYKELTLSRANRSVRLFNEVVKSLSEGKQPDKKLLSKVGYLYRTTAVYGSGKFGLADRFRVQNRPELKGPFRLEMMLVYFVRQFTFDQINHIAQNKNINNFVKLDENIAKGLGIGNSTGLGMAPFIVNHPTLLNNWVQSRENILKKIREIEIVEEEKFNIFYDCLKKSIYNVENWNTDSEFQKNKIKELLEDLHKTINYLNNLDKKQKYLFNVIYKWIESEVCEECLEYLVSMFMEPFDEIVKEFKKKMSSDEDKHFTIPSNRTVIQLRDILENHYSEIIKLDFNKKENNHNFWFISKNKEEPRLGNRFEVNGSELEQPLAIARDIKKLYERVIVTKNSKTIAEFLIENDDLRHVIRRAFIIEKFPYSEILDNTIGKKLMPIDMLRFKLSFFGAVKFDPRSDRWLRICMFQGAPLPNQLENFDDKWVYDSLN
tara:strand:- start:1509 stop:3167 length:1659 start_codon:yes stop_codon:yes gene_type:complete